MGLLSLGEIRGDFLGGGFGGEEGRRKDFKMFIVSFDIIRRQVAGT